MGAPVVVLAAFGAIASFLAGPTLEDGGAATLMAPAKGNVLTSNISDDGDDKRRGRGGGGGRRKDEGGRARGGDR